MYANDGNSHAKPFDDREITYSNLELDDEPSHPLAMYGHRLFKRLGVKVVPHSVLEEEENDACEFDIRMTDVPDDVLATNTEPDLLEVRLATLGKHTWQHTPHKPLLTSLVLLLLLVLLISISLFGHTPLNLFPLAPMLPQATQTTGFTRNDTLPPSTHRTEANLVSSGRDNTVVVSTSAVPHYCPTGTMLGQGRQIGNFPVWLSGIDTETATVHLPTLVLKTVKGWKGWVVPLHLAGRYKYLTSISLTALNIYGSATPLLHNPSNASDTQRIFIDPKHPMGFLGASNAPNIGIWDILLYLPSAGCYAISASWGQGHWLINFAAGQ